jgi:exopolysaccharide biosynthesis polyprenyl glycosylphosphotransferase
MTTGLRKLKVLILVVGDVAAAYLALVAALFIRYGGGSFDEQWGRHFAPFTLVFVLWLVILYIVGLYELDRVRNRLDLLSRTAEALVASGLVSLAVFYFATDYNITPKTNLVLTLVIFGAIFVGWRLYTFSLFARDRFRSRLLFLGQAPEAAELCSTIESAPHLGWKCVGVISAMPADGRLPEADTIVVSRVLGEREDLTRALYDRFFAATTIIDFPAFYESVRRTVPESALSEQWVLNNLAARDIAAYDHLKRPFDFVAAAILLVPAAPIMLLTGLAIWLNDRGPVFYRQERVGRGGKSFQIIKLRTMAVDAEKSGAAFASEKDPRITGVGRFLRESRLDELPQLWNILRGDMSFVGPRPERPEFEQQLAASIPLFPVRHLIRPGLTGWAQVNEAYAASEEDHLRKLKLDLYYIKHRSLTLDMTIVLKTIYSVLKRRGR